VASVLAVRGRSANRWPVGRTGGRGATSELGVDDILRDRFAAGRRDMIGAFAELTMLAGRAGVDPGRISQLHGRFFDGNLEIKRVFVVVVLLAEIQRAVTEGRHVTGRLGCGRAGIPETVIPCGYHQ